MQQRLIELVEQRGRLRERIAHQRQALARDIQPLRAPLGLPARWASQWRQARTFVTDHPYVLGTALLAVVALRPRASWRWARRGLVAWRTWRSVQKFAPGILGWLRSW